MEHPNLTFIQKLAGADTEFQNQLIGILKQEFPLEKKKFEHYLEHNNYKELAEIVHKLKHKISLLGLEEGVKIASMFENEIKKEKLNLLSEFQNILTNIDTFLKQLNQ